MVDLDNISSSLIEDDYLSELGVSSSLDAPKGVSEEDNFQHTSLTEEITYKDFLPLEGGVALGLDISKRSTGLTVAYSDRYEQVTFSIKGCVSEDDPHYETKMRRVFKDRVLELLQKQGLSSFDLIIVEDVFSGHNPKEVRLLYAINTAIDELILDGFISTKVFYRANNETWKSWLSAIYPGLGRLLNDKEKIARILSELGVSYNTKNKGYQDELDSLGMIIAYYSMVRLGTRDSSKFGKPKLPDWRSIKYYSIDWYVGHIEQEGDSRLVTIGGRLVTRNLIKEIIQENSDVKYIVIPTPHGLSYAKGYLNIDNFGKYLVIYRRS